MKISIITVVQNGAKTIEQTIQSVIGQSYPEIEYIIIDGGSDDGTKDIIRKYEDHLSYWVSEQDGGIYDAMNKALSHVSGDVVNFLNASDEYFDHDVIANISRHFADEPDTDVLIGRELIEGKACRSYLDGNCRSVYFDTFFPHQATFSKAKLYKDHGLFDQGCKICADYDWILGAFSKGYKLRWCDDVVAVYDPDGISSTPESIAEQYLISKKYLDQSGGKELMGEAKEHYLDMFRRVFFRNLIKNRVSNDSIKGCLNELLGDRTVDIWGAGNIGKHINGFLAANGVSVRYMLDSDRSKYGSDSNGTPIRGFDRYDRVYIIISTEDYEDEVADILDKEGLAAGADYMSYTGFSSSVTGYLIGHGYDDGGFALMTGLRYA